jgi:Pyruvate/2-oxoglutarate dehydrogenase complex, dihydrolipoamide acyltransferase (E2) component, and related enzymes
MPSLGADMDAGTITEWLVKPGDRVHRGDIVAVVDTDKADIDVEIFEDGVIDRILVPAGEKVPVGTPLATLGPSQAVAAGHPPTPTPEPPPARSTPILKPESEPGPAPIPTRAATPDTGQLHSPVLRRLARHLNVDVETVRGSGPGGAITRADIEAAASASSRAPSAVEPQRVEVVDHDRAAEREIAMRDAIARLMARSKREIPHYYLGAEADFSRTRAWLDEVNARQPVTERLLPAALLVKAVAVATHDVPAMNGFWLDDRYHPSDAVNVGVAISLHGGGLIAPAIHDADRKSLNELMHDLRDLVARTRSGRLRSSEMSDPTITVTNLGEQGVQTVYGVIYPPQVALVGVGRITDRPWAEHGMLGIRPVVSMTLAADHRASDGHTGARFLAQINRLLQAPETL